MTRRFGLPIWASLGAPLVGVPLMVGLLTLTAPTAETPEEEPEAATVTPQVNLHTAASCEHDAPDLDRGPSAG